MDLVLDLIATLSRWCRGNLYDISLAIMATLFVLFGPLLNAWVQRTVHVSALAFANAAQLDTLIEALKAWQQRGGGHG